jgi:hypothetical protein
MGEYIEATIEGPFKVKIDMYPQDVAGGRLYSIFGSKNRWGGGE